MRHCRAGTLNLSPHVRGPSGQFGRVHHERPDAKSDPNGLGDGEHCNQHSANLRSRDAPAIATRLCQFHGVLDSGLVSSRRDDAA
jgi:hypothetical protein